MNKVIRAGDTYAPPAYTVVGFPATDGWTLKFRLVPRDDTLAIIEFTAAAQGSDYLVQVGSATTATWQVGDYDWFSWVEKSGARYSVDNGSVTIAPDPATLAAGTDSRSRAVKALDDLENALATYRATNGHVQEYTIGNRMMRFKSETDIALAIDRARADVQLEEIQDRAAKGQSTQRMIGVRFQRV